MSAATDTRTLATPANWTLADDQPLTDCEGEPMILAVSESRFADALTGEPV